MLDPTERALVQAVLDHLDHEYVKPDIAFCLRQLRALVNAPEPAPVIAQSPDEP